jgi:hypothetical protein
MAGGMAEVAEQDDSKQVLTPPAVRVVRLKASLSPTLGANAPALPAVHHGVIARQPGGLLGACRGQPGSWLGPEGRFTL